MGYTSLLCEEDINCFLLFPTASIMPQRKSDLCKLVVRALFTGACVSFISACMAGILYVPRGAETDCVSFLNTNFTNRTYETYVCCRELFQSTLLNGTNMPSFSGPWQDKESSLRNLANCCDLYTSTVCAWGWWGHSMTVLIEQIRITKYMFMYLGIPFSENCTKLHKMKVLISLWLCTKTRTHLSTGVPHSR